MDKFSVSEQIKNLEAEIRHHKKCYAEGAPEIDDAGYDALETKLRELCPDSPVLQEVEDTSSQVVFTKIKHLTPMLSLRKCYTSEEFFSWASTLGTFNAIMVMDKNASVLALAMHKLDGFAVELRYVRREGTHYDLDRALSRGDGMVGEDITTNVLAIKNVPKALNILGAYETFTVRGEVVISKENFKKINTQPGGERFKSARNLATGTIHGKEPFLVKERGLVFIAYASNSPAKTFSIRLTELKTLVFAVVKYKLLPLTDIPLAWEGQNASRSEFDYDADGLVVEPDDVALVEDLGLTGHHPRGAIAWKFDSEVVQTKLLGIEWQVSRTGRINPVAVLEPITTEGATISKATLHNLSEMVRLKIQIGATVDLVRQGGVIPKIIKTNSSMARFPVPVNCPECNSPAKTVVSKDKIETLRCSNENCPAVSYTKILHYISCMDMKGFGPAALEDLMDKGYVKGIVDLYRLTPENFRYTDVGPKVAENIIKAIDNASKGVRLGKFIFALGIPGVGKSTAEALATHIGSAEKLLDLKLPDIVELPDAGEKTTGAILQYLSSEDVRNVIQILVTGPRSLMAPYVTFEEVESTAGKKIFVITGTLSIGRKEFAALIVKAGGAVSDTLSKKVNYLVAGEDCGGKLEKAQKLGVPILSEAEARKLLNI